MSARPSRCRPAASARPRVIASSPQRWTHATRLPTTRADSCNIGRRLRCYAAGTRSDFGRAYPSPFHPSGYG
eukprot:1245420-Prymnesium_polylepis.1